MQFDLDQDGLQDIITTSAQTQDLIGNPSNPLGSPDGNEKLRVEWHRNLGGGEFAYQVIREGVGGVFIKHHDIDQDGDQDLILSQFFGPPAKPSVIWLEQQQAPAADNDYAGVWAQHTIDSTIGLGYHMEVVDLNHDGRLDLVVGAHNHQDDPRMLKPDGEVILPGMYRFEIPQNPREVEQWPKQVLSQEFRVNLAGSPASQGTPGIFSIGDLNGDERLDIAVPGDGNDKLFVLIQRADGEFDLETVVEGEKMIAMAVIADVDGDGVNEIVAAKHNSNDGGTSLPPGFLKIYQRISTP